MNTAGGTFFLFSLGAIATAYFLKCHTEKVKIHSEQMQYSEDGIYTEDSPGVNYDFYDDMFYTPLQRANVISSVSFNRETVKIQ